MKKSCKKNIFLEEIALFHWFDMIVVQEVYFDDGVITQDTSQFLPFQETYGS